MNIKDRSERLLALLLIEQMKGSSQREKALKLNLAGFSNLEIADIMGLTSLQVAQALYKGRKGTGGITKRSK